MLYYDTVNCASLRVQEESEDSTQATNFGLTLETFMKIKSQKKWDELLALYCFYVDCTRHQQTQKVWATTKFVAKGLGWGEDKVKRVKLRLKELGLIEQIIRRNSGRISGHYVLVRYAVIHQKCCFTTTGENNPLENHPPNASELKGNAFEKKKKSTLTQVSFENPSLRCVSEDVKRFIRIYNSFLPKQDRSFRTVNRITDILEETILVFSHWTDEQLMENLKLILRHKDSHKHRTLTSILWTFR